MSQDTAMEGSGNHTYDGQIHQNNNHDLTELSQAEDDYKYAQTHQNNIYESVNGTGKEGPATNQGFSVNSGVYSYDEVNKISVCCWSFYTSTINRLIYITHIYNLFL